MSQNPRVYHGSHEHITAWAAAAVRTFRNWETLGTFFTTNPDHARKFGHNVHEVEFDPYELHLWEGKDLWAPFLRPAIIGVVPVKLGVRARKALTLTFSPDGDEEPLIDRELELRRTFKKLQNDLNKWHDTPIALRKRMRVRLETIAAGLDVMRSLSHDSKYARASIAFYQDEGYDGFYWPNADHDVKHDEQGEPEYRHDVFFLFNPERLPPPSHRDS